MVISFLYKIFRFFFFPIIFLADFLQNNLTSYFTPMNMGPVSEASYSKFIKKKINKNNFVLDFGSGAGFFSSFFNPKKYLGVEINKNFIISSRKKNKNFKYRLLKNNFLKNFENKIDLIFINNVMHHLTDKQSMDIFLFFRNKLKPETKIVIFEPLFPKTFFSLEFFMKVLDIGNNIKTKKNYLNLFKKIFYVKKYTVLKVSIGSMLVVEGLLNKN